MANRSTAFQLVYKFGSWISHWFSIVDAVFGIVTFTLWSPGLSFKWLFWWTKKVLNYEIRLREKRVG